jgi:hypothetical protein
VVDGVTVGTTGTRVLVNHEVTAANNGIYTLTQAGSGSVPWVLTRAIDFDNVTIGEIDAGAVVLVLQSGGGLTQGATTWEMSTTGTISVGTTAINWVQIAEPYSYQADGITTSLTGNTFSTKQPCANILLYGGSTAISADNSAALTAALAASASNSLYCVYFPSGLYRFQTSFSFTTPASTRSSILIMGDGSGTSQIHMTGPSNTGWSFTLNDNTTQATTSTIHFHGLQILVSTANVATAIKVNGTSMTNAIASSSTFSDLVIGGDLYGHYFAAGIDLTDLNEVSFDRVWTYGGAGSPIVGSGYGIKLLGTSSHFVYQFSNVNLNECAVCLSVGNYIQGVSITNSNMGGLVGISTPTGSGTARDQISVSNSQFNVAAGPNTYALLDQGTDQADVLFQGNLVILGDSSTGLYLTAAANTFNGHNLIQNNSFRKSTGTSTAKGILMTGSTSTTAPPTIVQNNLFYNDMGTSTLTAVDAGSLPYVTVTGNTIGPNVAMTANLVSQMVDYWLGGQHIFTNVPTSCSGLVTGTVRSNSGVMTLCP